MRALADEGNTDEGFDQAFDVLGDLGLYMASLRRHELTNPAREERSPHEEATALGLHIGASVGVVPRFATSHLATHNLARDGRQKSFTSLADEFLFLDYNTRGILAYMRAADALTRISPLGISHPVAETLFEDAHRALEDVGRSTTSSSPSSTSTASSTACGRTTSRTASAARSTAARTRATSRASTRSTCSSGSVAGTTRTTRSSSSRRCCSCSRPTRRACGTACDGGASSTSSSTRSRRAASRDWFQRNAAAFLRVCEAHGRVAAQHHDQLVARFIEAPSKALDESHLAQVTASGPPLPVLLSALEVLRDLRLAAPRDDIASRYADVARLRDRVGTAAG